ncbi:MAG: ABC transporter substrate-binding protein [Candidatus Bathyarchaeota archaeon]|nr:ABC transporter substrate-binding protein [Candidatus Bathyarchaeota archaeon]
MERSRKTSIKAFTGVLLGFLTFILIFSSINISTPTPVNAASSLFSITLLAPTTNPVRRQHAALIANALQSVGVNARVVYVTFSDLINRLFPEDSTKMGKTFVDGGYDIGFIGWGFTSPVPDIKSQYVGTPEAFPPTGNNYALYNSSEANEILNKIYTSLDSAQQLTYFKQLSLVLNKDKPYVPIYLPSDIIARKPEIKLFGDANVFSGMSTPFSDLQYVSGVTTFTFAEAGDWTSLAPWGNADSNSFYSLFVYGATQGGLQLVDPRTNTMYLNEASSVKVSTDGRTWTISIKPGIKFHDGVEVTSDDYLFAEMALMTPSVASVALSDKLSRFGNLVSFTWLNGTTTSVDNSEGALTEATSTFKAIDKYTYEFNIGSTLQPYAFLNQTECSIAPLPKHYLEKISYSQWNTNAFATGLANPYTFTWDTAKYGGTGTYTAYGPFGTGPYVYQGYDPVKRLSTLTKFDQYFNTAALEAKGYFTVETYNIVTIVEKDAAIAAYRTGEIDALDTNYQLAADQKILKELGANVFSKPQVGWQEMGYNMQNPIIGTGTDTPLGKSNPAKAAEAARHVRQAISYLIPRDLIVSQLLDGAGESGTTVLKAFGAGYQDASIKSDPYNPTLAKAELAAAGYSTGVSAIVPTPPAPEVAANFIYGQAVPIEGVFKNPVTGSPYTNFVVRIQESQDNTTWIDTGYAPITDSQGNYHAMVIPDWATTYIRAYFTGYTVSTTISSNWPIVAGNYYDQLVAAGKVEQILPPTSGPAQKFTTRTVKDILTGALQPYATADSVSTLSANVATKNDVTALATQVTALKSSVDSLTTYLYASIAIAVVAVVLAVYILMRKK